MEMDFHNCSKNSHVKVTPNVAVEEVLQLSNVQFLGN